MLERRPQPASASREVSLGDYVLAGGEVAALVVVEAVARLLPGVLGNAESLVEESHAPADGGLLEEPGLHQARRRGAGWTCPRCCSPGDHAQIARWRRDRGAAADGRDGALT